MIKSLLIGCGNIGAGYDLKEDAKVWTHAKAYSVFKETQLSVFDVDLLKAKKIARKYNAILLEQLSEDDFSQFDIVSITTPTITHFNYLKTLLGLGIPVIICEKPVVSSLDHVDSLIELYNAGTSKVIINYMRRFQEGYGAAKQKLKEINQHQPLKSVIIKYKRGFLNNAGHAADLLEFLFEQPFTFDGFKCSSAKFDAFEYDPTIVGSCYYMNCPVSFAGVADANYTIFEIELFFTASKIVICHSGNDIRYYYENAGSLQESFEERQTALLDTYMLPVIARAINVLTKQEEQDNFIPALRLNKEMLRIIEPLKSKLDATVSY